MNAIRKFLKEEDGVTALEYGLLAAIVATVLAASFKGPLEDFFSEMFEKLKRVASIS